MTITVDYLISHRFRGFAPYENTIDGLIKALDFGVKIVEFDIRVTKCGTPIIYHDEWALDGNGQRRKICDVFAKEFARLGGTFAHMPTADALFEAASQHDNKAMLLIDIKDFGFEAEINALVHLHHLQNRATYVSWVPNVLYRMSEIASHIPLCLSHWSQNPSEAVRAVHEVHDAQNGHIPRLDADYIHGERSGWFVNGALQGELRDLIIASKGSVCVPQGMVSAELVKNYHEDGIMVSTFSYVDWKHIVDHKEQFGMDLFFIDSKLAFEAINL